MMHSGVFFGRAVRVDHAADNCSSQRRRGRPFPQAPRLVYAPEPPSPPGGCETRIVMQQSRSRGRQVNIRRDVFSSGV